MKTLDIAFKDLARYFRSFFAVGMMVVAPLLLIGLIYFAFGGMAKEEPAMPAIQVGLVNMDQLPDGAPLEQSLGDSIRGMFFDESVASWITADEYEDENTARLALQSLEIGVAVIIPKDFTSNLLAGENSSLIRLLSDPTLTFAPQIVENMIVSMLDGVAGGGIAVQSVMERQQSYYGVVQPGTELVPELVEHYSNWYTGFQRDMFHNPDRAALVMVSPSANGKSENPMKKMLSAMMVGQMVFFAFFTGANAMMSILREDEEGTLARLFTTPVSRTSILAGKFLAVFLLVLVQGFVLVIATHFVFDMQWGSPVATFMALTGQVIAATGLGVFLVSLLKTTRQGGPVLGGGLTAMGLLGGLFTAGIAMPEAFTMLSVFTPQGWVMKGWNAILSGLPLSSLVLPLAVMTFMGLVLFVIGARLFQKRYA